VKQCRTSLQRVQLGPRILQLNAISCFVVSAADFGVDQHARPGNIATERLFNRDGPKGSTFQGLRVEVGFANVLHRPTSFACQFSVHDGKQLSGR
jgi:hypothetical protein